MIYSNTKVTRSTLGWLHHRHPLIIQQGGTSSGKTFGIILALIYYLEATDANLVVSVIGMSVPHLKTGALRDFDTICNMLGRKYEENKTDKKFRINGSTLEFISLDNPKKAHGGKRDICFINECNYIPYATFLQLDLRTDRTMILDYNPSSEFWLHENIIPHKDFKFKRTTYKDNPSVSEKKRQGIEDLKKTNPNLYRVYGEGKTGRLEGLIFTNVGIVDSFPSHTKYFGYGQDYGYTNDPTTLVKCGLNGGEIYIEEMIYERGLSNSAISQRHGDVGVRRNDVIVGDSSEPKTIDELSALGWNMKPAAKGPDSVLHGIQLLQGYKINIVRSSVNLLKESRSYCWAKKGDSYINKPVDNWNHCWDAVRYWASHFLSHPKKTKRKIPRKSVKSSL